MLYYQTTDKRRIRVARPIYCTKGNAWLGNAFYFWKYITDARIWGKRFPPFKQYEVYSSDVDDTDILDTVFNEEHYDFFVQEIEAFAEEFTRQLGRKPTIEDTCDYYNESKIWEDVNGILFQDLPDNELLKVEKYSYRKRIQLAVYKEKIIRNYNYVEEGICYGTRSK